MSENEKDENPPLVPDVSIKKSRPTRKVPNKDWQTKDSFDIRVTKEELPRPSGDQKTINELNELLEKEKEKSLRWHAKHDNLQKDLEKETVKRINSYGEKIILDFLTVYEDFIRARDAYEKENPELCSNLNSIIKKIQSILANYEVKQIETEGKKSDPNLHEEVDAIENNDYEEGTIVAEIAKGYIIRDKVLKYSKVCVSKKK